jgi:hypothetical protein
MQDTKHKVKALDKDNCVIARSRGKEAGVKSTSLRTETGYEAGDADELFPHNEVRVSASQVKLGVVLGKFTSLPGEACLVRGPARKRGAGTARGNTGGEQTGVSRGRSSAGHEPGVGTPQVGWAERPGWSHERVKDRTDQDCGDRHDLPAFELVRPCAAETDRGHRGDPWGSPLVARKQTTPTAQASANPENDKATRSEPPDTALSGRSLARRLNPYVRWCGGRRLITSGYPIRPPFDDAGGKLSRCGEGVQITANDEYVKLRHKLFLLFPERDDRSSARKQRFSAILPLSFNFLRPTNPNYRLPCDAILHLAETLAASAEESRMPAFVYPNGICGFWPAKIRDREIRHIFLLFRFHSCRDNSVRIEGSQDCDRNLLRVRRGNKSHKKYEPGQFHLLPIVSSQPRRGASAPRSWL